MCNKQPGQLRRNEKAEAPMWLFFMDFSSEGRMREFGGWGFPASNELERFAYRLEWKPSSSRRVEVVEEEEEINSRESSWYQRYWGRNVITDFHCWWDQAADRKQIKRAKIFNLQPGYITGRAWLQYPEVDGHIKISVRKQVDRKWGQLYYPILCPQVPHLPKVPQHTKTTAISRGSVQTHGPIENISHLNHKKRLFLWQEIKNLTF